MDEIHSDDRRGVNCRVRTRLFGDGADTQKNKAQAADVGAYPDCDMHKSACDLRWQLRVSQHSLSRAGRGSCGVFRSERRSDV